MNENQVFLHQISTALPDYAYSQDAALKMMQKLQNDNQKLQTILEKIYRNSAIETRYSVLADYGLKPEEYTFFPKNEQMKPEPSTKDRNNLYITESGNLALKALQNLSQELPHFDLNTITHLITVSCTGMSAPGFDFHLVSRLLNPSVHRFHIGFMGCFAAFPALKLARSLALSEPQARVLVVNVELCSLHMQQSTDMDMIVGNAIFADGASAALISSHSMDSEGPKFILNSFESHIIPESEGDMAWKIGDHGFEMRLSAYVPRFIEKNMLGILSKIWKKYRLTQEEIAIWAIHPGGRAILDRLAKSLQLSSPALFHSYETLKNYGNMSSVTILFVLKAILADENLQGKTFSAAFGPGLTVETGLFEKISC